MISSIGLIFALGIISSTVIYVDTSRPTIFQDVLDRQSKYYPAFLGPSNINPFPSYQARIYDITFNVSLSDIKTSQSELEDFFSQKVNSEVSDFNLEDKIADSFIQANLEGPTLELNASFDLYEPNFPNQDDFELLNISLKAYEITNEIRPELESLLTSQGTGSLPSSNNELLLLNLLPRNQFEISQDFNENASIYIHQNIKDPPYSIWNKHQYNVSGIIKTNQIYHDSVPNLVNYLVDEGWGDVFVFVPSLKEFSDPLVQNTKNSYLKITGGLELNYDSFNPYTIAEDMKNLKKYAIQLQSSITSDINEHISPTYIEVIFQSEEGFKIAIQSIEAVTFALLLYASPIILVTLFVANYSFGLIHRSVKQHVGILKTRGISDLTIFSMQLLDFIIIVLISLISSIIIGVPLSTLIIRTDYFLSFNNESVTQYVIDVPNLINILFWFGLLIGFTIHLARMFKLSKMTINESEIIIEKTEPYWYKHYLDIIFFFSGFFGTVLFNTAVTQQWFDFGPFILLGLPAPLLFIIGAILLFSRFFPIVLLQISSRIWIRFGGLFSFAIKNVIRHKQASTRAVMLIAVLIAFLISFLSIPYSNIAWKTNQITYEMGAEGIGYINGYDSANYYNKSLVHTLETNYSKYFDGISPFMRIQAFGNQFAELLVINSSTYQNATVFPIEPNSKFGLYQDMSLLKENNSAFNLLVQEKSLNYLDLTLEDDFTYSGIVAEESVLNFKVKDSFSSWPTLYYEAYSSYQGEDFYGVTSFDNFLKTNYSFSESSFRIDRVGFFFNFKNDVNQTQVADWLTGNFSISMDLLSEELDSYFTSVDFLVQTGQLNLNIVISILIALTILLMFAWLQIIERRKELFTERALGLKIYQLVLLFLGESLILLFSGIIIGTTLGVGLTELFSLFITLGPTIPPYINFFAVDLILLSYSIIILLAFIGALVPAVYVIKQDISSSFIGEG
jgi:ABC-type antimicrobial peptide transport system permease subunit